MWKSNTVTQFRDENNDKKRRIKVRRWTLKIIFIHKIFTVYQWSPFIYHTNQPFGHRITTYIKEISNFISFLSLSETVQIPYSCSYLEQVCKLVHFFRVVRSTGRVPNLNTNHCIYACYVHFYKKFSEILKKVLVKWLPVDFKQWNVLTGTFKLTETSCMGTWRDRVHSQ